MRCPTCKRRIVDDLVCSRCGTDLGILQQIRKNAEKYLYEAVLALSTKNPNQALELFKKSNRLLKSKKAKNGIAVSALLICLQK